MNRGRLILDYLLDREGQLVNTFTLERLGGRRSWRTRVSDARAMARLLRRDIENVQCWKGSGRRKVRDSQYRLIRLSKRKAA